MPADDRRKASGPPTLPNPWTTARAPATGMSSAAKTARTQRTTPDAVAPVCRRIPPTASGLPVTTSGSERPWSMSSVSSSQAMTRSSVLTSGAGMSRSGPSSGAISNVYRRVSRSSSPDRQLARIAAHPALAAAEGDVDHGGLERHVGGQRRHLGGMEVGVEADPPLGRAPGGVVVDPPSQEHLDVAVVHADGHGHLEHPVGQPEQAMDVGVEAGQRGGVVDALEHRRPRVVRPGRGGERRPGDHRRRAHGPPASGTGGPAVAPAPCTLPLAAPARRSPDSRRSRARGGGR